ncbi:MAG: hypothetical protein GAK29_01462 [Acinetobacter bereziniae]|uniref:Uncharacterized protein n=1 Tax=Acinetobacter bereziniae TaxID=106648 RepID=A0A833UQQ3_ACIBZ|nr:MAG: hypothetical protein GAK29_01462 [Acinetobacter bereziniae]
MILLYWKELIIISLVILCGSLGLKLQSAQYKAKEVQILHDKMIAENNAKTANIVATYQQQRQLDAEKYASEISNINDKYVNLVSSSNRMQQKVTTYNTNLHTIARETLETYAKTGTLLFNECRKEYIDLGQYTSKVDAELDGVTRTP